MSQENVLFRKAARLFALLKFYQSFTLKKNIMMKTRRGVLLISLYLLFGSMMHFVACSSIEGRHSFSLTTFSPSGKLGQVERAMEAASLGTPIVAVVKDGKILLASPQILPSVFMLDDGTARFSSVAPHIVVGHSGISADGRVLLASAQRLAVEHSYTFDEAIPVDLFLEEMALLIQEYTMKPGTRPFGTTLLIAHLPKDEDKRPELFRIDPSGAVTKVENDVAVINGKYSVETHSKFSELSSSSSDSKDGTERDLKTLCEILKDALSSNSSSSKKESEKVSLLPSTIIGASLTRQEGFAIKRMKSDKELS